MAVRDPEGYFELHSQDYHPRRLRAAVNWVRRLRGDGDSLFDVGCGTGLVLEEMAGTGITDLAGCDTAARALELAAGRVDFDAHRGSILDDRFVARLGTYRFVTMAAVLHHVTGPTRRISREKAVAAVRNSFGLVRPGGRLIVIEPTYRPRWAMTAVFWIKRVMRLVVGNRRIELGRWNNLGAPVVSYYSPEEVDAIVTEAGGRVIRHRDREARMRRLPRLLGVRDRRFTTVMAVRSRGDDLTA